VGCFLQIVAPHWQMAAKGRQDGFQLARMRQRPTTTGGQPSVNHTEERAMPLSKRDVYLGRGLGAWAFWLHRLSGLLLVFYLLLHILVISTAVSGKADFNAAMGFLKAPIFVALEMGLVAAVLVHGFNGVRIVLFDLGIGVKKQKEIFVALMAIAVAPFVAAVIVAWPHIFV
jgi:succinate dehydrogenase / fumarate reductase cytochrome b subunit